MFQEDGNKKIKAIFCLILTVIWMAAIFSMSARQADESAQLSGRVGEFICSLVVPGYSDWDAERREELADRIEYPLRKSAHAAEYTILGILLFLTLEGYGMKGRKLYGAVLILGAAYAASDEIHQLFVPGRSGQVSDVLLDSCGVATGILFTWLVKRVGFCKKI